MSLSIASLNSGSNGNCYYIGNSRGSCFYRRRYILQRNGITHETPGFTDEPGQGYFYFS